MRVFLACCNLVALATCANSVEPGATDLVPWYTAFEPIPTSKPLNSVVLLVITNDDPFVTAELDRMRAKAREAKGEVEQPAGTPSLWCAAHIDQAYHRLLAARPDVVSRLTIQGFAAGLPSELTGGEARNVPQRAVLAICDHQYRLLGFHVGVPHGDELHTVMEDAEEVAIAQELFAKHGTRKDLHQQLAQRSQQRLDRMWNGVLTDLVRTHADDVEDDDKPFDQNRFISIGETLDAAYLVDVRRRFGLGDDSDQARLLQLEQHFESRQPWCDSLIALTVGQDFSVVWRDMIEMTWHHPPVSAEFDAGGLLEWADLHLESDAMVLSIEPPARARRFPWPPATDPLSKRDSPWRAAHELALQHPYRAVSVQQLAHLIHRRGLGPIDIQRPSMARYLFAEPERTQPLVIGEASSPARFTRRLKRTKPSMNRP